MRPDVFARWLLSPAYGRAYQDYKAIEQEIENKERMTRTTPSASVGSIEERSRGSSDASEGDLTNSSSSSVISSNSASSSRPKISITPSNSTQPKNWLNASLDGVNKNETEVNGTEETPQASAASGEVPSSPTRSNRVSRASYLGRNNSLLTSIRKEMYKNRNSRDTDDRNSMEDGSIVIAKARSLSKESEEDVEKRKSIESLPSISSSEESTKMAVPQTNSEQLNGEIMKVIEGMEEVEKKEKENSNKLDERAKEKQEESIKSKPLSPTGGKKDVIAALRRARSTINFGTSPIKEMEEKDHCETCMKPIQPESGDGGVFLGFSWYHTDCLVCSGCKCSLAGLSPVIMGKQPYCHTCIVKDNPTPEPSPTLRYSISPKEKKENSKDAAKVERRKSYIAPFFQDCESCGKGINSVKVMTQLNGRSWHTACFICNKCSVPPTPTSPDLTFDEQKKELVCKSCLPSPKPRVNSKTPSFIVDPSKSPSSESQQQPLSNVNNRINALKIDELQPARKDSFDRFVEESTNLTSNKEEETESRKECHVCHRDISSKEAKEIHSKVFCIICYQRIMVIHQTRKHKK
eukprot:TRINITY_DN5213_c0_g1_i4.p1 TRINITY_DN5213_c0_g1~~TRINITY_DN5213_c0_g1_i4.p1  ORF type:complete len:578 (-),score=174.15 TRINITY_DN5213_c0_g1_i4:35-1768(-)